MENIAADDNWILKHQAFISASTALSSPKLLELGCGTGRDTVHLCNLGDVVAADLNANSLHQCKAKAPDAKHVCLDISKPLPFPDNTFNFVLASLSLHYFSWLITENIVQEMERVLAPPGHCIVRVNSINDIHFGADSNQTIEEHFFMVGKQSKRFFDAEDIERLFYQWQIKSLCEQAIDRYQKPKVVFEVQLLAPGDHNHDLKTTMSN